MAMLKDRGKDLIIGVLFALLVLPYLLMRYTPTAILVQNASADWLGYFINTDGAGQQLISSEGEFSSPEMAGNLTGKLAFIEGKFPGLIQTLKKTAMPDKTILVTALNAAWASEDSMLDLFLGSFHAGEGISHYLNHLLIVALDQVSYDRCRQIHQHCFRLETEGVDFTSEKLFKSDDYLKMMWRRVEFLRVVLQLGYDILFSDTDILWFRDPFPHLSRNADFQIACDRFNGNPTDLDNHVNGGFLYVRSSQKTVDFYKFWHESRLDHPSWHDQDVFNEIKLSKQFAGYHMNLRFLETVYFGGFCEKSRDLSKVCTMHANCCVGLDRKIFDLKLTLSDWAQYSAMTPQQRDERGVSWQAPRECLKSFR